MNLTFFWLNIKANPASIWTYPDSTDRYWLDSQADDDTGAGLSTAACVACDERDAAVGNPCWV